MPFDFDNRKPLAPEPTDLHGPGVDIWRDEREDNHWAPTDEVALRSRQEVRKRFIAAASGFVAKLTDAP